MLGGIVMDQLVSENRHNYNHFPGVSGFCEAVPDFTSFSKGDQDKLMKRAYYDLWTVGHFKTWGHGTMN